MDKSFHVLKHGNVSVPDNEKLFLHGTRQKHLIAYCEDDVKRSKSRTRYSLSLKPVSHSSCLVLNIVSYNILDNAFFPVNAKTKFLCNLKSQKDVYRRKRVFGKFLE